VEGEEDEKIEEKQNNKKENEKDEKKRKTEREERLVKDYYIPDNQQCTISQNISCNYWGMHRHLNLIKSKSKVIK